MKHQYFGDINDYRKYGLLRLLAIEGGLRLGIAWMLTQDDGAGDGGKTGYIGHPERWRSLDPELFDYLAVSVAPGQQRNLTAFQDSDLIPQARFHSDLLPDEVASRAAQMDALLIRFQGQDLVFFDPDNGLEVRSCPMGRKGSSKFLAMKEAEDAYRAGFSLLIYQHFGRTERGAYITAQIDRLREATRASEVIPVVTPHVLFLFALQPGHTHAVRHVLDLLLGRWAGQFVL